MKAQRSTDGANANQLASNAFELLLRALDANREQAGEKYERVRQRLVSLFRWRGCGAPEELADRTFDRVARRLAEGAQLRVADPYMYFHGVALNVLREHWRDPGRRDQDLEASPDRQQSSPDLNSERERLADERLVERRLDCLEKCLGQLPRQSRQLVERYHARTGGTQITARKVLADELGIPQNALRIRVYRLRTALQSCVEACVGPRSV